eukprot:7928512-Pyramimonas_sp.AAC.1
MLVVVRRLFRLLRLLRLPRLSRLAPPRRRRCATLTSLVATEVTPTHVDPLAADGVAKPEWSQACGLPVGQAPNSSSHPAEWAAFTRAMT